VGHHRLAASKGIMPDLAFSKTNSRGNKVSRRDRSRISRGRLLQESLRSRTDEGLYFSTLLANSRLTGKAEKDLQTSNPEEHSRNLRSKLQELLEHLRKEIDKVENPQAKALFETAAEVLGGLINAFLHYEKKSEKAWK
jgi:hypothetical protein